MPPPQQYFLRENLRLRLLTARVALLSRDDAASNRTSSPPTRGSSTTSIRATKAVQGITATLTQLAATAMPAELPDVAASLTALRAVKAASASTRPGGGTSSR